MGVDVLRKFFYPESVAVMGVSAAEDNLARNVAHNLLEMGYHGPVYLVGRGAETLFGLPVYTSVADVPGHVDLVTILVPARMVPAALRDWGEKGTRAAVVITAGFSEYGEERRDLEQEVLGTARRYGMRLIGPNCQGVINTDNGLCLPFGRYTRETLRKGRVAIISQSGSVAGSVAYQLSDEPLGVSKFVSVGNKLDVKEVDLLPLLFEDEQTDVICLYMEGIDCGRELIEIGRRSPKPIVVYKSNVSQAARRVAQSHTGAIASDAAVTRAALLQANMVPVDSLSKFMNYAKAFSLPPMKGPNLAVMSSFGGQAVIAADVAFRHGLNLPPIPDSILESTARHQKARVVKMGNPMDMGDIYQTEGYLAAFEAIVALPEVHGIVMLLPYLPEAGFAGITTKPMLRHIRELSAQAGKPVALSFVSHPTVLRRLKDEEDLLFFPNPEEAVEALAASWRYWSRRNLAPQEMPRLKVDREMADSVLCGAAGKLPAIEAGRILGAYGIPFADTMVCRSQEEAVEAARRLGYPVVLKVESADISHKSDVGGVAVGLRDDGEVRNAYQSMMNRLARSAPEATVEGILVQRHREGREVILGARQDESFGPVVIFGLGGVHVEVFKDAAFRLAPVLPGEAEEMVREIRGWPILEGVRGQGSADIAFLVDCLMRLSQLVTDFPQIREIDVNPMIVFDQGQGGEAVDIRVMVGGPG
ncbi:MAG: acetate--CoA ligase family protein [Dehalococcoidia bacterium]|nr:acetate--CoA ligase family protein [Dehalococcoidia bacterium]